MTAEIKLPPLPPGYMSSAGTYVYEGKHMQSYARAAVLADRQANTCKWTSNAGDFGDFEYWDTECGEAFYFNCGSLEENSFKYCPYCAGSIVALHRSSTGAVDHIAGAGKVIDEEDA